MTCLHCSASWSPPFLTFSESCSNISPNPCSHHGTFCFMSLCRSSWYVLGSSIASCKIQCKCPLKKSGYGPEPETSSANMSTFCRYTFAAGCDTFSSSDLHIGFPTLSAMMRSALLFAMAAAASAFTGPTLPGAMQLRGNKAGESSRAPQPTQTASAGTRSLGAD
jgi:hypothetical protein